MRELEAPARHLRGRPAALHQPARDVIIVLHGGGADGSGADGIRSAEGATAALHVSDANGGPAWQLQRSAAREVLAAALGSVKDRGRSAPCRIGVVRCRRGGAELLCPLTASREGVEEALGRHEEPVAGGAGAGDGGSGSGLSAALEACGEHFASQSAAEAQRHVWVLTSADWGAAAGGEDAAAAAAERLRRESGATVTAVTLRAGAAGADGAERGRAPIPAGARLVFPGGAYFGRHTAALPAGVAPLAEATVRAALPAQAKGSAGALHAALDALPEHIEFSLRDERDAPIPTLEDAFILEFQDFAGDIFDAAPAAAAAGGAHILLCGPHGSGKSSFFNSLVSCLSERVAAPAVAGGHTEHVTNEFVRFRLNRRGGLADLPVAIFDSWGIDGANYRGEEMALMLHGALPLQWPMEECVTAEGLRAALEARGERLQADPSRKIHAVVFIVSYSELDLRSETLDRFAALFRAATLALKRKAVVAISQVDRLGGDAEVLAEYRQKLCALLAISEANVFTLENYCDTMDKSFQIDRTVYKIALAAVRAADDFVNMELDAPVPCPFLHAPVDVANAVPVAMAPAAPVPAAIPAPATTTTSWPSISAVAFANGFSSELEAPEAAATSWPPAVASSAASWPPAVDLDVEFDADLAYSNTTGTADANGWVNSNSASPAPPLLTVPANPVAAATAPPATNTAFHFNAAADHDPNGISSVAICYRSVVGKLPCNDMECMRTKIHDKRKLKGFACTKFWTEHSCPRSHPECWFNHETNSPEELAHLRAQLEAECLANPMQMTHAPAPAAGGVNVNEIFAAALRNAGGSLSTSELGSAFRYMTGKAPSEFGVGKLSTYFSEYPDEFLLSGQENDFRVSLRNDVAGRSGVAHASISMPTTSNPWPTDMLASTLVGVLQERGGSALASALGSAFALKVGKKFKELSSEPSMEAFCLERPHLFSVTGAGCLGNCVIALASAALGSPAASTTTAVATGTGIHAAVPAPQAPAAVYAYVPTTTGESGANEAFVSILREAGASGHGALTLTKLGSAFRQKTGKEPSEFGVGKLSAYFRRYPSLFHVTGQENAMQVSLLNDGAAVYSWPFDKLASTLVSLLQGCGGSSDSSTLGTLFSQKTGKTFKELSGQQSIVAFCFRNPRSFSVSSSSSSTAVAVASGACVISLKDGAKSYTWTAPSQRQAPSTSTSISMPPAAREPRPEPSSSTTVFSGSGAPAAPACSEKEANVFLASALRECHRQGIPKVALTNLGGGFKAKAGRTFADAMGPGAKLIEHLKRFPHLFEVSGSGNAIAVRLVGKAPKPMPAAAATAGAAPPVAGPSLPAWTLQHMLLPLQAWPRLPPDPRSMPASTSASAFLETPRPAEMTNTMALSKKPIARGSCDDDHECKIKRIDPEPIAKWRRRARTVRVKVEGEAPELR
eukprot:tig00020629_g12366.t1